MHISDRYLSSAYIPVTLFVWFHYIVQLVFTRNYSHFCLLIANNPPSCLCMYIDALRLIILLYS